MEDTYREPESLKSDEFKKLKPEKEELLLDSSNTKAVKGVQSFLNSEGYTDKNNETLWVDGRYGANTANAVMKYQRANGLTVDGIVGDETWNSIYNKKKQKEEETFFNESRKNNPKAETYVDKGITIPELSYFNVNGGIPADNSNKGDTAKRKKEEEEIFEIMRNDLWGNIDSSYAKNVSEDEESFHDRVRKRWGNGGNPSEFTHDVWRTPRRRTTKGIYMPEVNNTAIKAYDENNYRLVERKDSPTSLAQDDFFINETEITNKWLKENDTVRKNEGLLFREKFPFYKIDERKEKIKDKVDFFIGDVKEEINDIKKKFKNLGDEALSREIAFGFTGYDICEFIENVDQRDVVTTDFCEDYDFSNTSAKNILIETMYLSSEKAGNNGDVFSERIIDSTINDISMFDEKSITKAYYLNDINGARGFGHAGILLVNSKGESILFSFYPQDQGSLKDAASEMRVCVFGEVGTKSFLENEKYYAASTSGIYREESYENSIGFSVSAQNGKSMFEQAVAIAANKDFKYNLLEQNCDHVALSILHHGGVDVEKALFPNMSYSYEIIKYFAKKYFIV